MQYTIYMLYYYLFKEYVYLSKDFGHNPRFIAIFDKPVRPSQHFLLILDDSETSFFYIDRTALVPGYRPGHFRDSWPIWARSRNELSEIVIFATL